MSHFRIKKLPALIRLFNSGMGLRDRFSSRPLFSLTKERALHLATKHARLSDFGEGDIESPLETLCESFALSPTLTPFGRLTKCIEIIHQLKQRLYLQDALKKDPAILKEEIRQPWFIAGLPRTGSTLLQRLLALDPAHRSPLFWESNAFYPLPSNGRDPRLKRAASQLRFIDFVDPDFKAIHEMAVEMPEECLGFLALGLVICAWPDLPEKTHEWAKTQDMTVSYQLHKRHLQLLQRGRPAKTWILKAPLHLPYLKWLLKIYPDARIIQTHRDLGEALPSAASLLTSLTRSKYAQIDPVEIGQRALDDSLHMLMAGIKAREENLASPLSQNRFVDVRYPDLIRDPLATVARIYQAFGTELGQEAKTRMQAFLAANKQHKWGVHRYSLEDFGLDLSSVRQTFAAYTDRFLN